RAVSGLPRAGRRRTNSLPALSWTDVVGQRPLPGRTPFQGLVNDRIRPFRPRLREQGAAAGRSKHPCRAAAPADSPHVSTRVGGIRDCGRPAGTARRPRRTRRTRVAGGAGHVQRTADRKRRMTSPWHATQRPMRILDFDLENRPLSYLGEDWTSAEITAIGWSWIGSDKVEVLLL